MGEHRRNLIVDIVALLTYAIVANPVITGVDLHEWLGLGVFIVFLVHVAMHVDWCVDVIKVGFRRPSIFRAGNLVLDTLILVSFMVCTVSGLMVSGAVLPALGLYARGYYLWDPLHATSAKFLLALFFVHVVVHWRWIVSSFSREVRILTANEGGGGEKTGPRKENENDQ